MSWTDTPWKPRSAKSSTSGIEDLLPSTVHHPAVYPQVNNR